MWEGKNFADADADAAETNWKHKVTPERGDLKIPGLIHISNWFYNNTWKALIYFKHRCWRWFKVAELGEEIVLGIHYDMQLAWVDIKQFIDISLILYASHLTI